MFDIKHGVGVLLACLQLGFFSAQAEDLPPPQLQPEIISSPGDGIFGTNDESYTCGIASDGSLACWGTNSKGAANPPPGLFTTLSSGFYNACGIKSDNTINCWGDSKGYIASPPSGIFIMVSAGYEHACAVRIDGSVACWGYNGYAQTTVPPGLFKMVSAGEQHTCGIKIDDSTVCWGMVGSPSSTIGPFSTISSGDVHACGIGYDGRVVCWGNNSYGQLATPPSDPFIMISAGGYHTCGIKVDGSLACWGSNSNGQSVPPSGRFTSLIAGLYHTCGIKSDRSVVCWGFNNYGQSTPPSSIKFGSLIVRVSAGLAHTCVLKGDGTVGCFGDNTYGQTAAPEGTFKQISASSQHTCGVKTDDTATCWGENSFNQSTAPSGKTFSEVSTGEIHSCGVNLDGTVSCWGGNTYGQTNAPTGNFLQISAGLNHTCGLKTDFTVACWGDNTYGQATAPAGTFLQLSAGDTHTCGLQSNRKISCWGDNTYGQATSPAGNSFTQVSSGSWHSCGINNGGSVCWGANFDGQASPPSGLFTQISVNRYHGCGVKNDGSVVCWGDNSNSHLAPILTVNKTGNGNGTINSNPTIIDCGSTCAAAYPPLSTVTLAAIPDNGSIFLGWNGVCTNLMGACNVAMDADKSTTANFSLASATTPTLNSAIGNNQQITLNWTAVSDATSYNIYQGTVADGELAIPVASGITGNSKIITGLNNGVTYYFRVAAVNTSGISPLSNEINAIPIELPPAPVIRATVSIGQIILNWLALPTATSYNLYQGTVAGGEDPTPIMTGITTTSVPITGLTPGVKYFFKVAGVNAGGIGPMSNEVNNSYTVTPFASTGGNVNPSTPQSIVVGVTTQFTVTSNSNYTINLMVNGTCPHGSWNNNVWSTGAIATNCTVVFNFNAFCGNCMPNRGGWRSAIKAPDAVWLLKP